jgi:hypothetical protein
MSPLEAAIIKRGHQQKQHRVSPPQLPLPLTAADMMNFLSAKSIEQHLAVAAAQAAAAMAITKEKQGPAPSISSVVAVASALAGSSSGKANPLLYPFWGMCYKKYPSVIFRFRSKLVRI